LHKNLHGEVPLPLTGAGEFYLKNKLQRILKRNARRVQKGNYPQ